MQIFFNPDVAVPDGTYVGRSGNPDVAALAARMAAAARAGADFYAHLADRIHQTLACHCDAGQLAWAANAESTVVVWSLGRRDLVSLSIWVDSDGIVAAGLDIRGCLPASLKMGNLLIGRPVPATRRSDSSGPARRLAEAFVEAETSTEAVATKLAELGIDPGPRFGLAEAVAAAARSAVETAATS